MVISVRQLTVAAISGSPLGAGYGRLGHKAGSLIAKIQRSGGTVGRLMRAESLRLFSLWLSGIIVCLPRAVNHYRDNAITYKAQRDKNAVRNWGWRTRQLPTCRCVSTLLALDAKYMKELADAKAENDALRDDVAAGRRRLHIKAVPVSQCSYRLRRG